jgi:prevent-host-death family protein
MVEQHDILTSTMDEIPISKFKATCLAVLERVRATNQPIRVTRFGKPVADIMPPAGVERPRRRFGTGRGVILGDIVGPVMDESDFEAAQEWPRNELNKDWLNRGDSTRDEGDEAPAKRKKGEPKE